MSDTPRDRVETDVFIKASPLEVFAALTDPAKYPTWGPEGMEGDLAPEQKPILDFGEHGGGRVAIHVVAFDPPSYFAYRWAQGQTDPEALIADPLQLPTTLVEFRLEAEEDGTRVRLTESGFAVLPGTSQDPNLEGPMAGWRLMLGALVNSLEHEGAPIGDVLDASINVPAPPARVFHALTHPDQWWAQQVVGDISPGEQPLLDFGQFGQWHIAIEAMEPPVAFSFRKGQGLDDPSAMANNPLEGPHTLVQFTLEPNGDETLVRVRESGFDSLPAEQEKHYRRAQQGWSIILGFLQMHLSSS